MKSYNIHTLRMIRLVKKIRTNEMAEMLGVKRDLLNGFESGNRIIDDDVINNCLNKCNVTREQYDFLEKIRVALNSTYLNDNDKIQCMINMTIEVLLNQIYKEMCQVYIQLCDKDIDIKKKFIDENILRYIRCIRYLTKIELAEICGFTQWDVCSKEEKISIIDYDSLKQGFQKLNIEYDDYIKLCRFQKILQKTSMNDETKHLCILYSTYQLTAPKYIKSYMNAILDFDRNLKEKKSQFKM